MFRTSYVHHQEDYIVHADFLWYVIHGEITVKSYIKYFIFILYML